MIAALLLAAAAAGGFPAADRPVAAIVSDRWSDEATRDRQGEARTVIRWAGVRPGMSVADVGAGEGYYTVRLARAVAPGGRVVAQDIVPDYRARLAARIAREKVAGVDTLLGTPDDPKLAAGAFDRIFLIHMYHEIESPYAFLWRLRPALKPGGLVAIVDADRPTGQHGTPPALLDCELRSVGFAPAGRRAIPRAGAYLALYRAAGARPAPAAIRPCKG
ncbi:MAG: methyltransferase domain-containing protein [Sphingomonas fennica]